MIFCNDCFKDKQIVAIIKSKRAKGKCPICGQKNGYLYDTDKDTELDDFFDELLDIYTPGSMLPDTFPAFEKHMIADELKQEWNIFSENLDTTDVHRIITSLSKKRYKDTPELFDSVVGIKEKYEKDRLDDLSILKGKSWEDFVFSIRTHNRFHTQIIDLKKLSKYISYLRKDYSKGCYFFRGRLCKNEKPFKKDEMGAPPEEFAKDGRANSIGISRLYLADSHETCIHEIRAGAFDVVTIGRFRLSQDIVVVDFKQINSISPFNPDFDYLEYYINKPILKKIDAEMGKNLKGNDSSMDYIPTQYLCDFIETLEYEVGKKYNGVEYTSTLNSSGYNIALFDPNICKCNKAETFIIQKLDYKYDPL